MDIKSVRSKIKTLLSSLVDTPENWTFEIEQISESDINELTMIISEIHEMLQNIKADE